MLFRYGVLSSPGWHIGGPPCHSYPKLLSLYKLSGELAVVPLETGDFREIRAAP